MGIGNLLHITQVTLYVLLLLLAFFVFIPIAINQSHFDGKCLLFASGEWVNSTGARSIHGLLFQVDHWGLSTYCTYPIFIAVISVITTIVYTCKLSINLMKGTDL